MAHPFTNKLLQWHAANPRSMPWKNTKDPYRIWLSEIILQQTRVAQGLPYYERITSKFPTVQHLANASEDEVLKSWEGLGYYTRARNLHAASKQVAKNPEGKFPDTYDAILELKGVGPYSAAAIASFAFDLPHAVVDGNVFRVLSRYFAISEPVDSTKGKRTFAELAQRMLDKRHSADYNQAIMNFGALVCKPALPECPTCIFMKECAAFTSNRVFNFPVKEKKVTVRKRWFNYLVLENKDEIIIEKRMANDIWKGLYQFPLTETATYQSQSDFLKLWKKTPFFAGEKISVKGVSKVMEHKLTHQTIYAQFFRVQLNSAGKQLLQGWMKVRKTALKKVGFPVLLVKYLSVMINGEK
ncbi:MAG: A/G-specific adenine glycosylase [Chitinophagales bacterium]